MIDLPRRAQFEEKLREYTAEAYRGAPLKADASVSLKPAAANPIPSVVGRTSPIKYVIYIIKENRTYDQVLGDLKQGDGDPNLRLPF